MSTAAQQQQTTGTSSAIEAAAKEHGIATTELSVEQAFHLGRADGIARELDRGRESYNTIHHRLNEAVSALYGARRAPAELRQAQAPERPQEAAEKPSLSEDQQTLLEVARRIDDPDDVLSATRRMMLWLELVQTDLACAHAAGVNIGTYCDDAQQGFTEVLGMIRNRLEIADVQFKGSYNRRDR